MDLQTRIAGLVEVQNELRENIKSKGISVTDSDHFRDLAPLVGEITERSYAVEGTVMLVSSSDTLTIVNLPLKPVEVGILCKDLRTAVIGASAAGYVVPDIHVLFDEESDTKTVEECIISRMPDDSSGTYTVTFGFKEHNIAHPEAAIRFQGGYIYTWLALFHSLYEEVEER